VAIGPRNKLLELRAALTLYAPFRTNYRHGKMMEQWIVAESVENTSQFRNSIQQMEYEIIARTRLI
jgi:hypothetical protein